MAIPAVDAVMRGILARAVSKDCSHLPCHEGSCELDLDLDLKTHNANDDVSNIDVSDADLHSEDRAAPGRSRRAGQRPASLTNVHRTVHPGEGSLSFQARTRKAEPF